ncbi:hypothetical protein LSH36_438g02034 [Paralvinella palmiformis]|uniref:G-protein coupled receptors family 1 profile domain-containing protein n=1 Tax=Paralvinella palmiformis TaxID=53620 RepID=A0AAD9JC73_9ANNE|nr:hypothetical protein LSH36_438g02034 [Paralvinella palmiformis]
MDGSGGEHSSYLSSIDLTNRSVTIELNGTGSANVSSSSSNYEIRMFQYYAWGVTGSIISSLGILGNVLSMAVLCHRRMRTSTSVYLIALAIYDSLVLVSLVLCMALPTIYFRSAILEPYIAIFPYIQPYAYPVALIAQTCSIYTTVGFTVERYIAVCYPLRAVKFCTISRAQKSVIVIFLSSFVYNIPRMFEYRTVSALDPETNASYVTYDQTSLSRNPLYQHVYFIYMNIFIMLLLPFAVLTALNILLVRAVRRSSRAEGKQVVSSKQRNENNLTVMLISVVAVFLVCQISSIFDNIFMATLEADVLNTEPFIELTCISSLMVITNSAVNFYLYCVFGEKFRRIFCQMFCRCLADAGAAGGYLARQDTSFAQRSTRGSGAARGGHRMDSVRSRAGSSANGPRRKKVVVRPPSSLAEYEDKKARSMGKTGL